MSKITSKRFVVRQSLIGKNQTIEVTFKNGNQVTYNHDKVYSIMKDNLNKLEYSFNSIERVGTPGVTGEGVPTPTVKLKVDSSIVTNISYYFDPSRTGTDSPIVEGSYLDVTNSPYLGNFTITSTSGQTITRGADTFKFSLNNEPEGAADITQASYTTSSVKAVGSIGAVRIVNSGGFYTRLPIVTSIQSNRQIERVLKLFL